MDSVTASDSTFTRNRRAAISLEVGEVVTIEPGLYFPDRAIGVRVEDTFVLTESGVESMCRSSYGLEP